MLTPPGPIRTREGNIKAPFGTPAGWLRGQSSLLSQYVVNGANCGVKRAQPGDDENEASPSKRAKTEEPGLENEQVDADQASAKRPDDASRPSSPTLPSSQNIRIDSIHSSWKAGAEASTPMVPPVFAMEGSAIDYIAMMYEDHDPDESFMADPSSGSDGESEGDESDTQSSESDYEVSFDQDDFMDDFDCDPEPQCPGNGPSEAGPSTRRIPNDLEVESVEWQQILLASFAPPPPKEDSRQRSWHRPGPSPLRSQVKNSSLVDFGSPRPRRVRLIPRDHPAYVDGLMPKSNLVMRDLANLMSWNVTSGYVSKGTPGARIEGELNPPRNRFTYNVTAHETSHELGPEIFLGHNAPARRLPAKGKAKEGTIETAFAIEFLEKFTLGCDGDVVEAEDRAIVRPDPWVMKIWNEHRKELETVRMRGLLNCTTGGILEDKDVAREVENAIAIAEAAEAADDADMFLSQWADEDLDDMELMLQEEMERVV
ncbi:hypothetical protein BC628DRAFT_1335456 [Trametes gibbosa]|nr:hypothetical protein BC628DRAFT_1335456 [Trametes gibbosa]